MTPLDVGKMLTFARMYDSRRPELKAADADAWHRLFVARGIGDALYRDLEQAVVDHYGASNEWLMPNHVVTLVKSYRRARLDAAGNVYALISASQDDQAAYQAEYRRLVAEIATGRRNAQGQLEAKP